MEFSKEIEMIKRGAEEIIPFEDLTKKLEKSRKTGKPLRIKYGIDPTKPDVHLGHLVPVRKMRIFQDLGHTGVVIIGDYTAQIGDPSGLDETRIPLTHKETTANAKKYMDQLYRVLDENRTEVHFQSEWFSGMTLMDAVHLMAKFTFAQLMAHETFRNRYEKGMPLSLHELVYPLFQAYDSIMLNADIELGGTDQKFNILLGRDLQKEYGQEPQVAILSPILIGLDGVNKMSKSEDNYIAVYDTPREKFGKIMSIPDSIIENYYEFATDVPVDELKNIKKKLKDPAVNPRDVKRDLAKKIVEIFHSRDEAEKCAEEFDKVFAQKELPDEIPEFQLNPADLKDGKIWIVKLLTLTGSAKTNSEARRLVQQGGVSVDKERITDENLELIPKNNSILQVGKRRFLKLKI